MNPLENSLYEMFSVSFVFVLLPVVSDVHAFQRHQSLEEEWGKLPELPEYQKSEVVQTYFCI